MRSASLLLLCAGLAGAAAAAGTGPRADRVEVHVTNEVSTGSLDQPSGVPVRQAALGLRYRAEAWTVQVDLPWRQVAGLRDAAPPRRPGIRGADEGTGDARLKLLVPLRDADPGTTRVDLVLRAKSGAGHAVGGFETGGAGQSVRLELLRPAGAWKLFGDAGWRRAGNLPGRDAGRHALDGELGAARRLAAGVEVGGFLDLRQHLPGEPAVRDATLYAALDGVERRWLVHVGRSLAPTRPDTRAGLTYRASF
ncbi:MAG TPA: hypothetical protein VFM98_06150 [Ramlibacter sp.]|uniref:hypothetical protein n=1 Tax=Ramlibacter sp. TaxID=1917967 RepID=UPI002D7F3481|nr:hypothetical protein [Ramlibacter sp.]HET8745164.1 hypothetical protein [Ramlibacter sp.]